jgi:hypothetical protein
MRYTISASAVKTSASSVTAYLKQKGFVIPHHVALELVAKALHLKNYNTLQALATSPRVIDSYETEKKYLIEMTCDARKEELLNLLSVSFNQANAQLNLSNFLVAENAENSKFNDYLLEIDLLKSDTNILMAMFLLCESFKKEHIVVTRFEYVRLACEKESMMSYFNQPVISTMSESNNSVSRKSQPFSELRDKMSPESQERASQRAKEMLDTLAYIETDERFTRDSIYESLFGTEKKTDENRSKFQDTLVEIKQSLDKEILDSILSKMKPHEKALLAIFATQGCNQSELARTVMAKMNQSLKKSPGAKEPKPKPDMKDAHDLLSYCLKPQVIAVLSKLKKRSTEKILADMLEFARSNAILAPSLFLWLRWYDEALWKVLNSVGRPSQKSVLDALI